MYPDNIIKAQETKEKLTIVNGQCKNCNYGTMKDDGVVLCSKYNMVSSKNSTCKSYKGEK